MQSGWFLFAGLKRATLDKLTMRASHAWEIDELLDEIHAEVGDPGVTQCGYGSLDIVRIVPATEKLEYGAVETLCTEAYPVHTALVPHLGFCPGTIARIDLDTYFGVGVEPVMGTHSGDQPGDLGVFEQRRCTAAYVHRFERVGVGSLTCKLIGEGCKIRLYDIGGRNFGSKIAIPAFGQTERYVDIERARRNRPDHFRR